MRAVKYTWNLRKLMADRGMFATSDLVPLLADRGVELSPSQVYRLVTGTPERLSLHVLAALCDALECEPGDMIEPYTIAATTRPKRAAGGTSHDSDAPSTLGRPRRAEVFRE